MDAVYLGIDLGGTNIRGVAATAAGEVLAQYKGATAAEEGQDAVIGRLLEAAKWLRDQSGGAEAIGIGAPGPLDIEDGVVLTAPHLPGWERVPLRKIIADGLGVPCALENDANAAAIGELRFGAGRGVQHLLYVGFGTGIGGGIIIDGRIYHGATGQAGEIGHMAIAIEGPRCECGRVGCWEALASGSALERRAAKLITAGEAPELAQRVEHEARRWAHGHGLAIPDSSLPPVAQNDINRAAAQSDTRHAVAKSDIRAALTGELIASVAAEGDVVAQELLRETGRYVGIGLASLANLLDPERIVVGGGFSQIGPLLWEPALAALNEHAFRRPEMAMAALGEWSGAFGAAALAIEGVARPSTSLG